MAISFVAGASGPTWPGGSSNNTSSVNVSKPTGTADGDVMIAICQSGGGINHSAPGGWTQYSRHEVSNGTNLVNTIFYKVASSEGSSYTFTDDSGGTTPMCAAIVTYRGVDTSAPINAIQTSETTGTDTVSTPSVTTTERCHMVHLRVGKTSTVSSAGSFAAVANYSDRAASANRGGSTQYFFEVLSRTDASIVNAGSQAGISFNADHTLTGSIERQFGIREYVAPVNATPTKASATVTAYAPASLTVSSTATYGAVTATAHDASVLTGVAAESVTHASATVTAYNAAGWVIHPVDVGAVAFDATVAVETQAEHATASVAVHDAVGYYGAPESRRWTIPAEDRSWTIAAESRAWTIPSED